MDPQRLAGSNLAAFYRLFLRPAGGCDRGRSKRTRATQAHRRFSKTYLKKLIKPFEESVQKVCNQAVTAPEASQ